MVDDGFDTQAKDFGCGVRYRWVWVAPGGQEFLGADWHKTKAAAVRAGREWLQERLREINRRKGQ